VSLYLDSALASEARTAFSTGLVKGITTNPSLVSKTGHPVLEVVAKLCDNSTGIVFHQLTELDPGARRREAIQMAGIRPGRVGLKIPCTYENLSLAAELVESGYIVGITAIFSTPQVYLACEAGAQYILPYVNRSTRLLGDGISMVRQMRAVIDADNSSTQIIAASIKTPDEAISTLLAGAHHLTLPIGLIELMGNHPLSDKTIEEFGLAVKR
jgi:transaldolase